MKKRILTALAAFAFIALSAYAIPAKPGFRTYTQPDGKTLTLEQKGDEYGSWFRDKSGNRFVMDENGYFQPITQAAARRISGNAAIRRARANNLRRTGTPALRDMTHGTRRIPVVLVEFSDVKFKINTPAICFDALLNQSGYNGYQGAGATGSVRDFYLDNSHGAFEPVFDVFGPVTLDNPIKYYGEQTKNSDGTVDQEDKQPELALYDACLKLDDAVDFSGYDYDSDGLVDMVLFYYAGGSQAEGWPSHHIWPHSWNLQWSQNSDARTHKFDGKKLGNYFCTAELKGTTTYNTMCSIGVTCHEFGHSLGLPDFYDVDYEDNGQVYGLYMFSTMSDGPYNDDSRTPPYFNAEERIMLGWMDREDIRPVTAGENTLPFIDGNAALKTEATADGEYFLYEKRGGAGNKWDAPLPAGMVVYHVDRSPTHTIVGGITAESIWNTNSINNYASHPCFYIIAPSKQESTDYSYTKLDYSDLVFPGFYGVDSYSAKDWDGNDSSFILSGIRVEGNEVHFTATPDTDSRYIEGTVSDTSGNPLEGVTVALNPFQESSPMGSGIILRKLLSAGGKETLTDESGRFSLEIGSDAPDKYTLSAALEGYVGQSITVQVTKKFTAVSFTLRKTGEFGMTGEFTFGDPSSKDLYAIGDYNKETSFMGAVQCARNIWGAYEGLLVKDVTFLTCFDARAYYFILDAKDGITAVKAPEIKPGLPVSFDISEMGIRIPAGDFYIGYAVEEVVKNDYDCLMAFCGGVGSYTSSLRLSGHGSWSYLKGYDIPMMITLFDQDYAPGLPDIGQPYIDIAPGPFKAGDKVILDIASSPALQIKSIAWTFDGVKFSDGSEIVLDAVWHTIVATISYADGSKGVLEREIEAK